MAESFFDRLKKTVIEGAATAATKAEEATKSGKLQLNRMSEERKLTENEGKLGAFVYAITQAEALGEIAENEEFIQLLGAVRLSHERIAELGRQIEEHNAPKEKAAPKDSPKAETQEVEIDETQDSADETKPKDKDTSAS